MMLLGGTDGSVEYVVAFRHFRGIEYGTAVKGGGVCSILLAGTHDSVNAVVTFRQFRDIDLV